MAQHEVHKTIALIDTEIRGKATGSPIELAGRLCMSVRMLYFYIDMMTSLGAEIFFSKETNSFLYEEDGYFKDGIRWIVTSKVRASK
ncbi:hypothetical protein KEM09_19060 [Carboxylicivirga mesophila]|uniref:Helix-turn-helix type 11 domain-containing protein n=1 Tax=Carboxylicivirga mesophila TaxID=1166478 RepID=A0ABS5KGC9_9BACT|nr:hypothetical protein [Carboxylicivirga mesophila]MBS2213518.1 hypothetical protein [Carboxylicivirga mesophila]